MSTITRGVAAAIDDLIDHCAKIEKGHEVLILPPKQV